MRLELAELKPYWFCGILCGTGLKNGGLSQMEDDFIKEVLRLASANASHIEYFFRLKNYSNPRTLELYWKAFRRFCEFEPFCVKDFKDWAKEDVVDLSCWLVKQPNKSLRNDNDGSLSETSVKNYLAGLKVLFNTLEFDHLAKYVKLKTIRTKVKAKDLITEEELRLAISYCTNYRDKALIGFYYDTMCRLSEGLSIRFSDVTYDKEHDIFEINIRSETTKTKRTKNVYVIEHAKIFKDFLVNHPLFTGWEGLSNNDCFVWVNLYQRTINKDFSEPLSVDVVGRIVKVAFKNAGVKKRIHVHLFRHSSATHYYKKHKDLLMLKKLGGWASNSHICEEVYINLSSDDIKTALLEQNGIKVKPRELNLCPNCGSETNPKKSFCLECGHTLNKDYLLKQKEQQESIIDQLRTEINQLKALMITH